MGGAGIGKEPGGRRRSGEGRARRPSPAGNPGVAWVPPLLVLAAGIVAYANSFSVPFVFDDLRVIVRGEEAGDLSALLSFRKLLASTRYAGYLSFALDRRIHGLNPSGYHLTNLAIHLVNALLLLALVRQALRSPKCATSPSGSMEFAPLFAALLFVAHPVNTQAVTYVVQRFASLATTFSLLAVVLYGRFRLAGATRGGFGPGAPSYAGALLCTVAAMKTKEIAFTLPLLIALYDLLFFDGKPARRALFLAPFLLFMAIIPLTLLGSRISAADALREAGSVSRVQTEISRMDYLFTQTRAVATYIRLLFFPAGQHLDYHFPASRSLAEPQVLLSSGLLLAIFGGAAWLLSRYAAASPAGRLVPFGVFWFFLALSVESSVIPIADFFFEHRVYLPSAGAFLAIGAGTSWLVARFGGANPARERAALAAFAAIVVLLCGLTHARNRVWGSEVSLWEDVVRKSPGNVRGQFNLAKAYAAAGRPDAALERFGEVVRLSPGSQDGADALGERGLIRMGRGETEKAREEFEAAIRTRPDLPAAHVNLGVLHRRAGRPDPAIWHFSEAVRLSPGLAAARNGLGLALLDAGRTEESIRQLDQALIIDPGLFEARANRGVALLRAGRFEEAIRDFDRALELRPGIAALNAQAGDACLALGRREDARARYRAACSAGSREACEALRRLFPR